MLVLERKYGESFVIGEGENQTVVVVTKVDGNKVWLGIQAPQKVPIWRTELLGPDLKPLTPRFEKG